MTTRIRSKLSKNDDHHRLDHHLIVRSRLTFGLLMIALGVVFLLQQANIFRFDNSWWVIFLAIPGFVALGSATLDFLQTNQFTRRTVAQVISGMILLVLSAIFIWDPTWSFTQDWQLDKTFPFLRNMGILWQWMLLTIGIVFLGAAVFQRSTAFGVVGTILCIVGAVFVLNISWNLVWPLFLVGLGVWMLFKRRSES